MNALAPVRNSLSLTAAVLRTRSASEALPPAHDAVATRSPLNAAGPEVTLSVVLALSPGATGPGIVAGAELLQPAGTVRPSCTLDTGAPVSGLEPGANVCRRGGPAGVRDGVVTVPSRPWPDESTTVVPPASSKR